MPGDAYVNFVDSIVNPRLDRYRNRSIEEYYEDLITRRRPLDLITAAHHCAGEVFNGAFDQLFCNSTGALAPEAIEGFRLIGHSGLAQPTNSAMELLGDPYPRDWQERLDRLDSVDMDLLFGLSDDFCRIACRPDTGFEAAVSRFVQDHPCFEDDSS